MLRSGIDCETECLRCPLSDCGCARLRAGIQSFFDDVEICTMLKEVATPILALLLGVGLGFGGTYSYLQPQVAQFDETVTHLEERNETLSSQLESLQNENQEFENQISSLQEQVQQMERLQEQLDSLKLPDVKIVGDTESRLVNKGGSQGYLTRLTLVNFGLEEATNIRITLKWWQLTACGCSLEVAHTEIITVDSISGQDSRVVEDFFTFSLDRELEKVSAEISS